MKAVTTWDPFRELDEFQHRLSHLFNRGAVARRDGQENEWLTRAEWAPLVDIAEDEKEYLIKAELPEVAREDVKVKVERGVLTIIGERKAKKEECGKKFHRIERSYGSFVRSFTVPEDADADRVSAEYKDGMLKVHLPKTENAKPREIDVKIS